MKKNVYEIITEQIITSLESNNVPWRKSWSGGELLPKNLISDKHYSGLNFFLLQLAPFESSYFLTFNQIKEKGGSLKKGSKSLPITFYKILKKDKKDGSEDSIPMLRYYRVFNMDQVEGIEKPKEEKTIVNEDFSNIVEAEKLLKKVAAKHANLTSKNTSKAVYSMGMDEITIPLKGQFSQEEEFYCTAFHEIIHSTGHVNRLDRETLYNAKSFGDHAYSEEELVAELGASFLCAICGISNETIENSQAYIKGWLKVLKSDPKIIHRAASKAQKAVNYLFDADSFEGVTLC